MLYYIYNQEKEKMIMDIRDCLVKLIFKDFSYKIIKMKLDIDDSVENQVFDFAEEKNIDIIDFRWVEKDKDVLGWSSEIQEQ
jgi:hypothetical protein